MRIDRKIERIASLGLAGSSTEPIEFSESDTEAVITGLVDNRVLGLFISGFEAGVILAEEPVVDRVVAAHDEVMSQTMRIEIAAVEVSTVLVDAGIDHRLLKGAALAQTIATNPLERSFRDVDLLVPSADISKVVQLLLGAGATRLQPELRLGYDQRFAKSVTMRLDGVEIDLHRTLSAGPFGVWMRPNDLFLLKEKLDLGGRAIPTLDRTDHLIHACYHAALGQVVPVLSNLRDIALLAGTEEDMGYDAERFDATIARWRGRAVIRRSVGLVQRRLDVDLPSALGRYLHEPVDASELAAVEPYLTEDPNGRFAALAPATLRALPLTDRAAYALAVGLPNGSRPLDRVTSMMKRLR